VTPVSSSFLELIDLASERLGAAVVAANDEFFAPKENLIRSDAPRWRAEEYTDRGKWMDGWETRRRREAGNDWCIVRLGVPGIVCGVDVDTTHFRGNCPEACAIDVCSSAASAVTRPSVDLAHLPAPSGLLSADWLEILPRTPLDGDAHNLLAVEQAVPAATHVRLRIFPDGGVARLRVHGEVVPDWGRLRRRGDIDLAAVEHGGTVVASSDMFFGSRHNLIMPGAPRNMGDGWETRRRRGPGHDWTIVRLGAPGTISRIEIDTRYFKGNAPGACSLEGCVTSASPPDLTAGVVTDWRQLMAPAPLEPDARQTFEDEVRPVDDVTHVRFNIYPDGGVGRLRLFGRVR
jgi:allantoicase